MCEYLGIEKSSDDGVVIDDGCVVCRACRRKVVATSENTSKLLVNLSKLYAKLKKNTEITTTDANNIKLHLAANTGGIG